MRDRGCLGRIGCLIVLLILVLVGIAFWQGGYTFWPFNNDNSAQRDLSPAPANSAFNGVGVNAASQLIFRFTWQGEQIIYNGNAIDEEYFAETVKEAQALGGRVECQQSADVSLAAVERWRAILDEVGVAYQGC